MSPRMASFASLQIDKWIDRQLQQLQLPLQYTRLRDHKSHYNYNYATSFTLLHSTTLHYTTLQYRTLQYTTLITLHYNYNSATPHCNYNSTTLHYNYTTTTTTTTLHHTTSSSCGEVTTAAIATTPKNTTPITFRSISGFALPSLHHNNSLLL